MEVGGPEREERSDMFVPTAETRLKALLRKAADRTVAGLPAAIDRVLDVFTPKKCANLFQPPAVMRIDPEPF